MEPVESGPIAHITGYQHTLPRVSSPSRIPTNESQVSGHRFRDINVSAINLPSLLKQSGCSFHTSLLAGL
ncbi:MAG: hypothetical protein ACYC1M_19340 [Armatimonadota bacterium]